MDYRFPKIERICLKREIDALFAHGDSFFSFPFRCVYIIEGDSASDGFGPDAEHQGYVPAVRVLFSVGKRYSKRAVCRNLIKRRSREAFRLNKPSFAVDMQRRAMIAFIYVSKREESFETIDKSVKKILSHVCGKAKQSDRSSS
ncbi:MAG: ribonuclease P protein component [Rikenellaceae bacterium]|nr:ribonuclease P protein component [Rikenellaceae bacterium]